MAVFIVKCRKVIVTDVEVETTDTDKAREIVLQDIGGYMSGVEPTTVTHLISAVYRRDGEYDYSENKGRKSKSLPKKIPYAGANS